jgi:hypothetical protein
MTLTTAQMRKHAQILRGRDASPTAQASADLIEAQAELADAEAGRPAEVAESAAMVEEYPIIGKVTREAGKMTRVEKPWTDEDVALAREVGVDIAWEWTNGPESGLRQGELVYIWIGTDKAGPVLQWDRGSRAWSVIKSRGNYGKNWACGGNWRVTAKGINALAAAIVLLDKPVREQLVAALENHADRKV